MSHQTEPRSGSDRDPLQSCQRLSRESALVRINDIYRLVKRLCDLAPHVLPVIGCLPSVPVVSDHLRRPIVDDLIAQITVSDDECDGLGQALPESDCKIRLLQRAIDALRGRFDEEDRERQAENDTLAQAYDDQIARRAEKPRGFDLRLTSAVNGVSRIPTEGKNLVVVAAVDQVLHFRIFDGDGKMVVDTDETRLRFRDRPIQDLRGQLASLWPPHELTRSEKRRVITAVTSIVRHTGPRYRYIWEPERRVYPLELDWLQSYSNLVIQGLELKEGPRHDGDAEESPTADGPAVTPWADGQSGEADASGSRMPPTVVPLDLVTLGQASAMVHRSKRTLERYKTKGRVPAPAVEGGRGRPDFYDWKVLGPWLESEFGIKQPADFPANRRHT